MVQPVHVPLCPVKLFLQRVASVNRAWLAVLARHFQRGGLGDPLRCSLADLWCTATVHATPRAAPNRRLLAGAAVVLTARTAGPKVLGAGHYAAARAMPLGLTACEMRRDSPPLNRTASNDSENI